MVAPAPATITLGNLTRTYDGAPQSVTTTTTPAGIAVTVTYDGSATAPANAGSYAVVASIADPNYQGSASGTLVIGKAAAAVTLTNFSHTYDGTGKSVTATTTPSGLAVTLTYGGGAALPVNAGSYSVAATVNDANYAGSASGTLVIAKAQASLSLGGLFQRYDGQPSPATATTDPASLPVNITYDGSPSIPVYPGDYEVVATIDSANYTGSTDGTLFVWRTALVRHGPTLNGKLDGSLQVLLPESITLNGNSALAGDLLVPGTPAIRLNGQSSYTALIEGNGATTPTSHTVTLNGQATVRNIVRRIDAIAMPVVALPTPPASTRDVTLNNAGESPGDFATLRNLTLNGNVGAVAVPPGAYGAFIANGNSGFVLGIPDSTAEAVYDLQGLTLNGNSTLQIVGPVLLRVPGSISLNGSVGSSAHPEWLELQIHSGHLTLNGGVTFSGTVITPNGTVTINGSCLLLGEVFSDSLVINGNGILREPIP